MYNLVLKIIHHDGSEEIRDLAEGQVTIGREKDNWLSPVDLALSRRHAVIHHVRGATTIEDLGTRNGTFVNGNLINSPTALAAGDVVEVGKTRILLVSSGDSADTRRVQPTIEISDRGQRSEIVAVSAIMRDLIQRADKYARSDLPVLITGETGTGKELFAQRIHLESPRRDGPFVILNCPTLAPSLVESELFGIESGVATDVRGRSGRLEEADGGTLFLDEVGDLSLDAQAKLLRFLQDGSVERVGSTRNRTLDVRLVAATNQDLDVAQADGSFRSDLFFRIAAARLDLPPLREHLGDLEPLIDHLLQRRNLDRKTIDASALGVLRRYAFPGNVRELDAIICRAAALSDSDLIRECDLALARGDDEVGGGEPWEPRALLESIAKGEVDFWEAVHRPFIERELTRAAVRRLVEVGLQTSGGSVKAFAESIGEAENYRKLLDFLRNNRLLP